MVFSNAIAKIRARFEELNKAIFFLSIVFGFSSWVVFSGVMVEAPLLMKTLPEAWTLPSVILAVAQLGQIGPILLYFMKCQMFSCCPGRFMNIRHKRVPDRLIIYSLFAIGLASMASIALFWDKTFFILGKNRSIPFLTGIFFLAILDCTCTIVFLTYIGKFKKNYVTALYIGEGISSLLPALFSLAQGIGEEDTCDGTLNGTNSTFYNQTAAVVQPNFSVSAYFWILFAILLISLAAFVSLDKLPCFTEHKISSSRHRRKDTDDDSRGAQRKPLRTIEEKEEEAEPGECEVVIHSSVANRKGKYYLYLAITLVSFLLYGFIPGLSSYSAAPYGAQTMHLAVTLALIVQPISSVVATFVQIRSIRNIFILLLVSVLFCSYIIVMSALSPCPLLKAYLIGDILMVSAWIIQGALLMYLRCCVTTLLKRNYGEKSLVACGLLTQIGQFIGSILIYVLVDLIGVFKEAKSCTSYTC